VAYLADQRDKGCSRDGSDLAGVHVRSDSQPANVQIHRRKRQEGSCSRTEEQSVKQDCQYALFKVYTGLPGAAYLIFNSTTQRHGTLKVRQCTRKRLPDNPFLRLAGGW
jgi:hypothetical protein